MAKKQGTTKETPVKNYTLIGIDGGGTHTRGIIVRNGETLATSVAGTTRVGAVGVGESSERLLNVIKDLCEQSEIDSFEVDAIVIGLAGVWLEEEKMRTAHLLKTLSRAEKLVLNDLIVTSDAELAVQGAFDGGAGIIMIVGTGSIALAKTSNGVFHRCGGWGIELDDEGSGAWIGREGITAIFRAMDGRGEKTILAENFAELIPTINLKEPRTIVKAYAERNFEYQLLTPLVMQAAEQGDKICLDIIKRASLHLMELLVPLSKNYKSKVVPVTLMGGVVENDTLLADLLLKEIKKNKKYKLVKPKGTALQGAISFAVDMVEKMS